MKNNLLKKIQKKLHRCKNKIKKINNNKMDKLLKRNLELKNKMYN